MKWPQTEPPPCLGLDQALPSKFAVARLSSSKVLMISSENVSMPQLVWWMTNHSLVPSSLCEITSERMASSVARPPALRITWASPSASPAYLAGSSRASMQVRIAKCRAGGMASLPFSPKLLAYCLLASRTASKDFVDMVFDPNTRCAANILTTSGKYQRNEIFYRQRAGAKNVLTLWAYASILRPTDRASLFELSISNTARVYTADDKTIQTPNSDTPYSFVGADLRAEPLVPRDRGRSLLLAAIHRHVHLQFWICR